MKHRIWMAGASVLALCVTPLAHADVDIDPTADANDLLEAFLGEHHSGVVVTNVTYSGFDGAAGTYEDGPLGMPDGILLTSGLASYALAPNDYVLSDHKTSVSSTRHNLAGHSSCDELMVSGYSFDATRLTIEFDLEPGYAGISFLMSFGTDEFPDFVGQVYNDVFSARLYSSDGGSQEIALDYSGDPITINGPFFSSSNVVFASETGTEYDGSTPILASQGALQPGSTGNVLELVICDGYDDIVDSGVFLAGITGCVLGDGCGGPTRACEDVDADGDGVNACDDCDEANPDLPTAGGSCDSITPDETCDGADNDGDGSIDEGFDDNGNGVGDCLEGAECDQVHYPWSEFVASGSELFPGLPSDTLANDTRAGSLEINTLGNVGFGGEDDDPPFHSAIVTLANGAGQNVEQLQVNRRWPPTLGADGCNPASSTPECWIWNLDREVRGVVVPGSLQSDNTLSALLPDKAGSSNDAFDGTSGERLTVSGGLMVDYDQYTGVDNGHQVIVAQWEVPQGRVLRQETELLFRGRYDWDDNGLNAFDPFVTLFRVSGDQPSVNFMHPAVSIVEDLPHRLKIKVNVQAGLGGVRSFYDNVFGFPLSDECQPEPVVFRWDEFVSSAAERWPGLYNDFLFLDTRAGSVEYNSNGGYGTGLWTDPAFDAGTVTLRNGAGSTLEKIQVNRRWPPVLDSDDCDPNSPYFYCWVWDDNVVVDLPEQAFSSNDFIDSSGRRVAVEGVYEINGNLATGFDQYHQRLTATFYVPDDRDLLTQTQFKLRGRYDWDCNGLGGSDTMITLFENDLGAMSAIDGVEILSLTGSEMTITVNKQVALNAVRDAYTDLGFDLAGACQ